MPSISTEAYVLAMRVRRHSKLVSDLFIQVYDFKLHNWSSIILFKFTDDNIYAAIDEIQLNKDQNRAVETALIPDNKLLLIQGPPGK